jgi:hypothetical protein
MSLANRWLEWNSFYTATSLKLKHHKHTRSPHHNLRGIVTYDAFSTGAFSCSTSSTSLVSGWSVVHSEDVQIDVLNQNLTLNCCESISTASESTKGPGMVHRISIPNRGRGVFSSPLCPYQPWGSASLLSNEFIHSTMVLQPFVGPWPLLQFRNLFYRDGRTPWPSDQPVARSLPVHRTTKTQNKRPHTSMPWVGFEPTIPAFEGAKTVHALDRATTMTGLSNEYRCHFPNIKRPESKADHSTLSNTEVKDAWSCTSTPPYLFMLWCLCTGTALPLLYREGKTEALLDDSNLLPPSAGQKWSVSKTVGNIYQITLCYEAEDHIRN